MGNRPSKRARLGSSPGIMSSSSVEIQYPETVLNVLEKPSVLSHQPLFRLSREDAFRNYAQYPTSRRAPAIWRAFHIIVLNSDIATFSTEEWNLPGCNIGSIRGETDEMTLQNLSDYEPGFGGYDVLDVDIGDGAGKIFRVRIIYNVGDADCNTGVEQKIYSILYCLFFRFQLITNNNYRVLGKSLREAWFRKPPVRPCATACLGRNPVPRGY